MYYLHHLSDQFIGFNVFLYVTFRAIAAAVTAFLMTLMFGNAVIRELTALKVGQPIRGEAEVHRLAELHGVKQGTRVEGAEICDENAGARVPGCEERAPGVLRPAGRRDV